MFSIIAFVVGLAGGYFGKDILKAAIEKTRAEIKSELERNK